MRLIGRNPMKNNKLHTYRISSYARDKNHIERPYWLNKQLTKKTSLNI